MNEHNDKLLGLHVDAWGKARGRHFSPWLACRGSREARRDGYKRSADRKPGLNRQGATLWRMDQRYRYWFYVVGGLFCACANALVFQRVVTCSNIKECPWTQPSLSLNWRIILNCRFTTSEVLSLILDIESVIGIMGNEHIFLRAELQCLDSLDSNLGTFD